MHLSVVYSINKVSVCVAELCVCALQFCEDHNTCTFKNDKYVMMSMPHFTLYFSCLK